MSPEKKFKFLAPFLALALALFASCSSGDTLLPPGQYPADIMTKTQNATATDQPIVVNATTKTLILSDVSQKNIYLTRINPNDRRLAKENTRTARSSLLSPLSASKSAEDVLTSLEAKIDSGFDFDGTNDPHKKIYEFFQKNLEAAKVSSFSKSPAPQAVQAAVTNYKPGDTEKFWALDPKTLNRFYKRTFKLLVSEANYNVWVDVDDKYYTQGTAAFETAAQNLGTNFINGYGLTSHLYGQPAENLYIDDDKDTVYGPMATFSKTGLKINIMLYDMLTVGKVYGFVYHGDVYHNIDGSNEGRFVYIDSQTTLKTPFEANSTAQHEFSHTISRNQKRIVKKTRDWTYWYGELLAMICEDMMQAYLGISDSDIGVDGGMGNTPKARLPQANALAWSNGLSGEDSLAYAATFQFGAWLTRNFGGAKFIKELAQNSYVDMDSILMAVNAMGLGVYNETTLLQKFAGDLLKAEAGKGFNQDATTYPGNPEYTCGYTDSAGVTRVYTYPITAINLWDPFYAWCDTPKASISASCINKSVPFSSLPGANMYKKGKWESSAPEKAFLGPFMLKTGAYTGTIGPYGCVINYLGTTSGDTTVIDFKCAGGESFSDTVLIWVK